MLPSKFYSGLEAVVFIALRSSTGPVNGREICADQNVSSRHLEPLLQLLVRHNILKSTKGAKGGYTLAREKRRISVALLIDVLLSDESILVSDDSSLIRKSVSGYCESMVVDALHRAFAQVTLDDLCQKVSNLDGGLLSSGEFEI